MAVLREGLGGAYTAGGGFIARVGGFVGGIHHIPLRQRVFQRRRVYGGNMGLQATSAVEFGQNTHYTTGAVNVFHMVFLGGGCDFAQARHLAADAVDVGHFEIDFGFVGGGQQVQNGVGGTAHCHVQAHGVFKCGFAGNIARQYTRVVLFVIALGDFHNQTAGFEEQFFAAGMGGQQRAVARQRQAQGFGEAVH